MWIVKTDRVLAFGRSLSRDRCLAEDLAEDAWAVRREGAVHTRTVLGQKMAVSRLERSRSLCGRKHRADAIAQLVRTIRLADDLEAPVLGAAQGVAVAGGQKHRQLRMLAGDLIGEVPDSIMAPKPFEWAG